MTSTLVSFDPWPLTDHLESRRDMLNPGLGEVARRDLERYYDTLAAELHRVRLTVSEAWALCDLLNSTWVDGLCARHLADELEDGLVDGIAQRWGIDGLGLIARLRRLGPTALLAICDAVERWWALPGNRWTAADLHAVGLVRDGS